MIPLLSARETINAVALAMPSILAIRASRLQSWRYEKLALKVCGHTGLQLGDLQSIPLSGLIELRDYAGEIGADDVIRLDLYVNLRTQTEVTQ
jgi:hypothetical protein